MIAFSDKVDWTDAAEDAGYNVSSWGQGSADAYNQDGKLVGVWTAFYDLNVVENYEHGWLKQGFGVD